MNKDVDEQAAAGLEPGGDAAKELFMVPEVLEALDGVDAVDFGGEIKGVEVGSDDSDVAQATLLGFGLDVLALGGGVGDTREVAPRELGRKVQQSTTPATAE